MCNPNEGYVDIVVLYAVRPPSTARLVVTIPTNGNLPNSQTGGFWYREHIGITAEEARHLLQTEYSSVTQPKC